jgi:hypothetical protein
VHCLGFENQGNLLSQKKKERKERKKERKKGAAVWSSGLAHLLFVLRVRSLNPGIDTGEEGTNHLFSNRIYIFSALTCLWTQIWTSMAYLAPSME